MIDKTGRDTNYNGMLEVYFTTHILRYTILFSQVNRPHAMHLLSITH